MEEGKVEEEEEEVEVEEEEEISFWRIHPAIFCNESCTAVIAEESLKDAFRTIPWNWSIRIMLLLLLLLSLFST